MVVEALVASVLNTLSPMLQQQLLPVFCAPDELERLSSAFTTLTAILKDAERKQVQDETLRVWLQKLRDVSYEVDDLLDEWKVRILRSEIGKVSGSSLRFSCVGGRSTAAQRVSTAQTWVSNLKMGISMGYKIKRVRMKLDTICKERSNFGLVELRSVEDQKSHMGDRETSSLMDGSDPIFGRNEEKADIIGKLIGDSDQLGARIPVLSVVGFGGLGKTTLAQLVYNDSRVVCHFDVRIWVCVSEDFDVKRLTRAILESATGKICEYLDLDPLQRLLQQALERKKFLLVLDDVWNNDPMKWEKLKLPFGKGSRRSRILLTTRSDMVASVMETCHKWVLDGLAEDECWSLFESKAFAERRAGEYPELEIIGREIVKKLKGVPLAV